MFASAPVRLKPRWHGSTRELTLDGVLVKRFRTRAGSQILILESFEELGWPDTLPDPLPKTRLNRQSRLHNAIAGLNRAQVNALLKFERNGTGCEVCWRVLEDPEAVKANPRES